MTDQQVLPADSRRGSVQLVGGKCGTRTPPMKAKEMEWKEKAGFTKDTSSGVISENIGQETDENGIQKLGKKPKEAPISTIGAKETSHAKSEWLMQTRSVMLLFLAIVVYFLLSCANILVGNQTLINSPQPTDDGVAAAKKCNWIAKFLRFCR